MRAAIARQRKIIAKGERVKRETLLAIGAWGCDLAAPSAIAPRHRTNYQRSLVRVTNAGAVSRYSSNKTSKQHRRWWPSARPSSLRFKAFAVFF